MKLGELDLHLAGEGRHERIYERLGAHLTDEGVAFAVWAPNARGVSVVGDWNLWEGRAQPLEPQGSSGIWAALVPEASEGDAYKFEVRGADGRAAPEVRPVRVPRRDPAEDCVPDLPVPLRVGRRRLARAAPQLRPAAGADLGLRGASGLMAARARLEGIGRAARRLRRRSGLHARRVPAGDAAPVLGLVGLSGDRLLRARLDAGRAGRVPRARRRAPPGRDRRHPRLGAGALPARRVRARALRRHGALRARGPAPGRASRLGHADLQPRPERGAQLPARQRALLAARVPRRRAARRRGRVDALPRLLAQAGRVGAERARRPRGSRGRLLPARAERGRLRPRAGRDDDRGGVDRVARRLAADLPRRARLRPQVEHGLDARHARVRLARSPCTAASTTTS